MILIQYNTATHTINVKDSMFNTSNSFEDVELEQLSLYKDCWVVKARTLPPGKGGLTWMIKMALPISQSIVHYIHEENPESGLEQDEVIRTKNYLDRATRLGLES